MSRICVMTPLLQPVQIESVPQEGTSNWDDTTWNESVEPIPWWSARESLRMLRCSAHSQSVGYGGYPSPNSLFGSSKVH
jgi:hypothetical protein